MKLIVNFVGMAAPKGNKFWELRAKHGVDALFTDPDKLWDAAAEYFEWCEENPLIEIDYKGKDADMVEIPKMRAFTIMGLCLFLDCNEVYFNHFKTTKTYSENQDFSKVVTRIEQIIYTQKFTGAAAGFLNPNIIARDLGLKEKSEVEVSDKREELKSLFTEIGLPNDNSDQSKS